MENEPTYWCNVHKRRATAVDKHGNHVCDPNLAGITIPCSVEPLATSRQHVEKVLERFRKGGDA